MIAFKDFAPEKNVPVGTLIKTHTYDTFDDAVARANAWIAEAAVSIISVESVGGLSELPWTLRLWYTRPD